MYEALDSLLVRSYKKKYVYISFQISLLSSNILQLWDTAIQTANRPNRGFKRKQSTAQSVSF